MEDSPFYFRNGPLVVPKPVPQDALHCVDRASGCAVHRRHSDHPGGGVRDSGQTRRSQLHCDCLHHVHLLAADSDTVPLSRRLRRRHLVALRTPWRCRQPRAGHTGLHIPAGAARLWQQHPLSTQERHCGPERANPGRLQLHRLHSTRRGRQLLHRKVSPMRPSADDLLLLGMPAGRQFLSSEGSLLRGEWQMVYRSSSRFLHKTFHNLVPRSTGRSQSILQQQRPTSHHFLAEQHQSLLCADAPGLGGWHHVLWLDSELSVVRFRPNKQWWVQFFDCLKIKSWIQRVERNSSSWVLFTSKPNSGRIDIKPIPPMNSRKAVCSAGFRIQKTY